MSLKIWLPLNGSLENKGLYPSVITNVGTGVTFNDNGKIGKCGYFNAFSHLSGTMDYSNFTEWSVSLWFKNDSPPSTWNILCNLGKANGFYNEYTNLVLSGTALYAVLANGSSTTTTAIGTQYQVGVWNHVVVTYKNRTALLYLNGSLVKSYTLSFDPAPNGSTVFTVGRSANSAEPFLGYINDIRIYDHCLSASEVHELSLGLVLHYKMDRIDSGSKVIDSSGYDRNGLIYNGVVEAQETARYSKSLDFDGSTGYINYIDEDLPFSGDCEFTFSAWIKWEKDSYPTNYPAIMRYGNLAQQQMAGLLVYQGKLDLDFWNVRYLQNTKTMNPGEWHHVAATKTPGIIGTTSKLYIDGEEVAGTGNSASLVPNIQSASSKFVLGVLSSNVADRWFNGKISDVRVYATALSADDIKKLYLLGLKIDNNHNAHSFELSEIGPANLITGIGSGNYKNVTYPDGTDITTVVTSGVNADTYFKLALSENLIEGETYTISCEAEGIPDGMRWGFPIGGQSNNVSGQVFYISNGYNEFTFVANSFAYTNPLMMDDLNPSNNVRLSQATFRNFRFVKNDTSQFAVKRNGITKASHFVEGAEQAGIYSGGSLYANSLIEL